jgi:hypothetical protein
MGLVIHRFKKFNLYVYNYTNPIIFISASDPDDACYKCITSFSSMILKQDDSVDTATLLRDTIPDISIKKIIVASENEA